ncbi:MAG: hypothetical protein JKY55_16700 [Aliivibrio sp.]|uniref:hypothetical protein n=1 Tax=Aliivibrio sp. TaxID=1872443 RepID=UPI001A3BEA15|nr:hypothetical protein [Aliivibrio sp.]
MNRELGELVQDFITMNQNGEILNLCQKHYDEQVLMYSNGSIFASSMEEAYNKQKVFVDDIKTHNITFVSKSIHDNVTVLIFRYKMMTHKFKKIDVMGKHTLTWSNGKIVEEHFETLS